MRNEALNAKIIMTTRFMIPPNSIPVGQIDDVTMTHMTHGALNMGHQFRK